MNRGGAELICLNQIRYLLARNYKVDLVLFSLSGERLAEIPDGARLFVLGRSFPSSSNLKCSVPAQDIVWIAPSKCKVERFKLRVRALWRMRRPIRFRRMARLLRLLRSRWAKQAIRIAHYINEENPDAIVAHMVDAQIPTLLGRRMSAYNPRIISSIHNVIGHESYEIYNVYTPYIRLLSQEVDRIHAVSKGVAGAVSKHVPEVANRVIAIHNPIEISEVARLAKHPAEHRWFKSTANTNDASQGKIILTVGRMVVQKNHLLLIHAFAKLRSRLNVRLAILGEGELRPDIENLVREYGIDSAVSMPGWVANPYAYMARADLFVLSSSCEGFGNVLVEALACGCPVVSTDCPHGPSEILDDGRWGRLVPCDDVDALSDAMAVTLAEGPPPVENLRRRANDFAPERIMKHYERLILDVIPQNRGKRRGILRF